MTGIERIAAERQRQVEKLGWTPEHDDEHRRQELAWAAVCYAAPHVVFVEERYLSGRRIGFRDPWPVTWDDGWDKRPWMEHGALARNPTPAERLRALEKAGALIAAEIDRLEREHAETRASGRCSVCGSQRQRREDGSWGACSLVPGGAPGDRGCPDPLYDFEQERGAEKRAAIAAQEAARHA